MLGIEPYVKAHYTYENLIILTQSDITLKLAPNKISFIELIDKDILISYTDGKCVKIPCKYGVFKNILSQISMRNISCLRQIYRSIIINVNQIANIQINRNIGNVYLFGEDKPKPLGIKYRCNLQEFISEV